MKLSLGALCLHSACHQTILMCCKCKTNLAPAACPGPSTPAAPPQGGLPLCAAVVCSSQTSRTLCPSLTQPPQQEIKPARSSTTTTTRTWAHEPQNVEWTFSIWFCGLCKLWNLITPVSVHLPEEMRGRVVNWALMRHSRWQKRRGLQGAIWQVHPKTSHKYLHRHIVTQFCFYPKFNPSPPPFLPQLPHW